MKHKMNNKLGTLSSTYKAFPTDRYSSKVDLISSTYEFTARHFQFDSATEKFICFMSYDGTSLEGSHVMSSGT